MAASWSPRRRPRGQHDPVYGLVRDLVREAREKAGLTQRDLAALLRRDRSYVWKSEQGERRMDLVDVVRWANACGADPIEMARRIVREEASRGGKRV